MLRNHPPGLRNRLGTSGTEWGQATGRTGKTRAERDGAADDGTKHETTSLIAGAKDAPAGATSRRTGDIGTSKTKRVLAFASRINEAGSVRRGKVWLAARTISNIRNAHFAIESDEISRIQNQRPGIMSDPSQTPNPNNLLDHLEYVPFILWLTGLSGAGKSTIASILQRQLSARGRRSYILDGDILRTGINSDLGFSDADRVENIRRTAEIARLLADAGLIVIVALISPFRRERAQARTTAGRIPFLEVYVDAPLEHCEKRDPKGLYRRARCGEIAHFTGIDSAYEVPESPDLHLDTHALTADEAAGRILSRIQGTDEQV